MRLSCSKVLPRWATASSTVHGMSVCCREGRVHAESGDAWYVMDHPDRKQFDLNERTVASGLTGRFRLLTYVYVRMYLVGRLQSESASHDARGLGRSQRTRQIARSWVGHIVCAASVEGRIEWQLC